jgi:Poly(ADP-ribose) polymerase catalytic domain
LQLLLFDFGLEIILQAVNIYSVYDNVCLHAATAYGKGVYFARDFFYSSHDQYSPPDRNKIKYVFQCRVLTGQFVLGFPDFVEPPIRDKKTSVLYDTVVDHPKCPSIFVVFHDAQAYPEYIVSFRAK